MLADTELRVGLEEYCVMSLLWGLANPNRFESWYKKYLADSENTLPTLKKAGLAIDTLPSLVEFYEQGEQILRDYEQEIQPLPLILHQLVTDAEALGRKII
ncbi:MAG: hypothetical protein HY973_04130 [Candidatus Kerfeldbacteria bacterium]|nr:hypothetical protein [Candidatus Kerfeldbacteria bacterium]